MSLPLLSLEIFPRTGIKARQSGRIGNPDSSFYPMRLCQAEKQSSSYLDEMQTIAWKGICHLLKCIHYRTPKRKGCQKEELIPARSAVPIHAHMIHVHAINTLFLSCVSVSDLSITGQIRPQVAGCRQKTEDMLPCRQLIYSIFISVT